VDASARCDSALIQAQLAYIGANYPKVMEQAQGDLARVLTAPNRDALRLDQKDIAELQSAIQVLQICAKSASPEDRASDGYLTAVNYLAENASVINAITTTAALVNAQVPSNWRRLGGSLRMVGGVLMTSGGVTLGTVTSPTAVGGVVGAGIAAIGVDQSYAGARQLISGLHEDSNLYLALAGACNAQGYSNCESKAGLAEFAVVMWATAYPSLAAARGPLTAEEIATLSAADMRAVAAAPRTPEWAPRSISSLEIPQGITAEQFVSISSALRTRAAELGLQEADIVIQGSRASGTARFPTTDLDIAFRVSPERFESFMNSFSRLANVNPGSAAERTRNWAVDNGIIQTGEARMSALAAAIRSELGFPIQISVVRSGGRFDNGPQIPTR
jgi:hypothetical protein